jgi:pyruvate/2-oxoglutarate dehydrogenase complex dihydrolipoamide dehydrogenase (E3) component
VADGHVDAVAMTRGHIADPHIVNKLREGREDDIRQCVGANYCADFAGTGGLCIQNPATGRERTQPHILPKAGTRRKVVVVGGGPGGLEAAGADLRLGHSATEADILAEDPDVVFIATGAVPVLPEFAGRDLCVTSWDIISGRVQPGQQVLVCDETGLPAGIGCADMLASRGAEVELVSADRMTGEEVGATLHVAYYRSLYRNGAILTPNHQLTGAYREGNRLIGVLTNLYTGDEEEREIDQIVHELGTLPRTAVYDALRARSRNLGEVDSAALIEGRPQEVRTNPHGAFDLYRIGDALVGRNVHAAIYDAARFAKVI